MFKHTLFLISVFILTILSGCQNSESTNKVSLNDQFSLAISQTAEVQGEQLTIKFEGIREDSRCPKGAACIWQGRVSCVLQVSDSSDSTKIVLTEPGLSDQYGKIIYKEYEFTSHVQPYPELGKKISNEEYRVLLTIKKIPFGSDYKKLILTRDILSPVWTHIPARSSQLLIDLSSAVPGLIVG